MADDPVKVGRGVAILEDDFARARGRLRSALACADLGTILAVKEGEGTREVEAGRIITPVPKEKGDLITIGVANMTKREKI